MCSVLGESVRKGKMASCSTYTAPNSDAVYLSVYSKFPIHESVFSKLPLQEDNLVSPDKVVLLMSFAMSALHCLVLIATCLL